MITGVTYVLLWGLWIVNDAGGRYDTQVQTHLSAKFGVLEHCEFVGKSLVNANMIRGYRCIQAQYVIEK